MQEKIGAFAQELAVLALLFVLGTGSAFAAASVEVYDGPAEFWLMRLSCAVPLALLAALWLNENGPLPKLLRFAVCEAWVVWALVASTGPELHPDARLWAGALALDAMVYWGALVRFAARLAPSGPCARPTARRVVAVGPSPRPPSAHSPAAALRQSAASGGVRPKMNR
ncbi:MAG: hypothetical protein L0Y66_23715, partial [Myxococcaceae bacterium]|nr:hypothetical protein [Myxococcaceae bacterium]